MPYCLDSLTFGGADFDNALRHVRRQGLPAPAQGPRRAGFPAARETHDGTGFQPLWILFCPILGRCPRLVWSRAFGPPAIRPVLAAVPGMPYCLDSLTFGGADFDTLSVTCDDKIFKRKLKVRSAPAFLPPVKPAPPRL